MSSQMESAVLPQHQGRRASGRRAFFGGVALGVFMAVLLAWPLDARSQAAKETAAPRPAEKPDLIQPGDCLRIILSNPPSPDLSLRGVFRVERSGKVSLGPEYGRVPLKDLTLEEAEVAIQKHLSTMIKRPSVEVTRYDPAGEPSLEERIGRLEKEVRALRTAIEELPKKMRN